MSKQIFQLDEMGKRKMKIVDAKFYGFLLTDIVSFQHLKRHSKVSVIWP